MFSIVLPTWNNLSLLQLCVRSIRENSAFEHQIIVHVNDGSDGTLEWVKQQGLDYTHSQENIGICWAVNQSAALAKFDYILYLNDDMYCCPDWDTALVDYMQQLPPSVGTAWMLSGTMIEPKLTRNPCVVRFDYGQDAHTFNEAQLKSDIANNATHLHKEDWYGSTWPPTLVHKDWWIKVGGYSSELSPGMASDNDFAIKMWHAGCRVFIGVGASKVHHFMSKSTGKVQKNNGRQQFLNKWGMTISTFDRFFIQRGHVVQTQALVLPEPDSSRWAYRWHRLRGRIKRLLS
ncbi:glycosyltransferase family 2 protein [Hydromonas duriensis]|uniref:GT2 family glycosyltransferase n=1 Tax=Hydromonas duriensis TaxID=1527608 RepID=A0A4R6Y7I3_9BURK|nr:glycosyltransferase [Hydromonas duriensis]TDR31287.1 GT2 family glycosyltransferase [Hydromonas duriensis]